MQRNKALVEIGGAALIERQVRRLTPVCREVVIVANDPSPYRYLGIRTVPDRYIGKGPLAGLHAGLAAATTPFGFVVACDMPFFSVELAIYLLAQASGYQAVVPSPGGNDEPLHAVYTRECLPAIEWSLEKDGVQRVVDFFPRVKVRRIDDRELGNVPQSRYAFININTPGELMRARDLAAGA